MTLDEYQEWVRDTALYPPGLNYPAGTLASEAGEVFGVIIKQTRRTQQVSTQHHELALDMQAALKSEMSDVLWALAALCNECNISLSVLADFNVEKLKKRQAAGTLFNPNIRPE